MTDHIYLTYKEAAERFDTSRSKVTRAVKSGILVPETQKRNGRDILTIRLDHLQEWAVQEGLECPDVTTAVNREHPRLTADDHGQPVIDRERPRSTEDDHEQSGPSELHDRLIKHMEQVHRRAVVLELQLQQTQRLLCENNESQHEKEARALEAEAKAQEAKQEASLALEREGEAREEAEVARQEAAQAKIELESLKTEMAAREAEWAEQRKPWYKKLFRKSS